MRKVVYSSRATVPFDDDALVALLTAARARNSLQGVTGALIFSSGGFLQLIEGDDHAVGETYQRISVDPRHTDVRVLTDEETSQRRFADWSMSYHRLTAADADRRPPGLHDPFFEMADPTRLTSGEIAESLLAIYCRG